MKQIKILRGNAEDVEQTANNILRKLHPEYEVIDIKLSASRYSETVMIIYE